MKKTLLLFLFLFCITGKCFAAAPMDDYAYYYSETNEPVSGNIMKEKKDEKIGTSEAVDIMHLVTTGDAGIKKACQNGEITKIHRIEQKQFSIYLFYKKYTTIVYGE